MITKELIELCYDAANAQRWNDHLRPHQGFTELDKQAHKMLIAYVLAKYEEQDRKADINWRKLIEGGLFEFLHRLIITDIKPPVYYELMRENGDKINRWVLEKLRDVLQPLGEGFFDDFASYLCDDKYSVLEKRILKAAHYLATDWEFKIVYQMNKEVVVGIEDTRMDIASQIEEYFDLIGVQKISLNGKTKKFIDLVGQLRFQKRWAQSPRVPETSVMGHMLIVAIFAYFCARELKACDGRLVNDYLCGLLHDLPEVLTRDIISPVKRSVEDLDRLIKEIEGQYVREKILPLVPASWHEELKYFTEREFETRVVVNGEIVVLEDPDEISQKYNEKKYRPVDGAVLKCCDNLAALLEAKLSIQHGITSRHLQMGIENIGKMYKDKIVAGIDFGRIFGYFDEGEKQKQEDTL